MLAKAMKHTKSADPKTVAMALEGMKLATELGEVEMRAADHQLIQPLFISTIERAAAKGGPKEVKHDLEGTGIGCPHRREDRGLRVGAADLLPDEAAVTARIRDPGHTTAAHRGCFFVRSASPRG